MHAHQRCGQRVSKSSTHILLCTMNHRHVSVSTMPYPILRPISFRLKFPLPSSTGAAPTRRLTATLFAPPTRLHSVQDPTFFKFSSRSVFQLLFYLLCKYSEPLQLYQIHIRYSPVVRISGFQCIAKRPQKTRVRVCVIAFRTRLTIS
jgi:hypothetical protein